MGISLYDVSVAGFIQTLTSVAGFLGKGRAHFAGQEGALAEIVEMRIAPDMLPFRFQILSVVHHSRGAIEGAKAGLFAPPGGGPKDYAGLQQLVADALDMLKACTREEIEGLQGKDMVFALGENKLPFVAEDFLMSFSIPNLHFHATTAYGMLRAKGVPLGKRDYLGRMRMKK